MDRCLRLEMCLLCSSCRVERTYVAMVVCLRYQADDTRYGPIEQVDEFFAGILWNSETEA